MVWLIDNPVSLVEHITTAASTDPLSALLVAVGAAVVALSAGGFGVLALGGILDVLVPAAATQRQRHAHD